MLREYSDHVENSALVVNGHVAEILVNRIEETKCFFQKSTQA